MSDEPLTIKDRVGTLTAEGGVFKAENGAMLIFTNDHLPVPNPANLLASRDGGPASLYVLTPISIFEIRDHHNYRAIIVGTDVKEGRPVRIDKELRRTSDTVIYDGVTYVKQDNNTYPANMMEGPTVCTFGPTENKPGRAS